MAKIVNSYFKLPQNVAEQISFKKHIENTAEVYCKNWDELIELITTKYTNSKITNKTYEETAVKYCTYIKNAGAFGFCQVDFKTFRELFLDQPFSELYNTLKNLTFEINNNRDIVRYVENGNIEKTLTDRIEEVKRMKSPPEQ